VGAPSDLRMYVAVTSPYPWDRGVTIVQVGVDTEGTTKFSYIDGENGRSE